MNISRVVRVSISSPRGVRHALRASRALSPARERKTDVVDRASVGECGHDSMRAMK
jgi:hypothetical protein